MLDSTAAILKYLLSWSIMAKVFLFATSFCRWFFVFLCAFLYVYLASCVYLFDEKLDEIFIFRFCSHIFAFRVCARCVETQ